MGLGNGNCTDSALRRLKSVVRHVLVEIDRQNCFSNDWMTLGLHASFEAFDMYFLLGKHGGAVGGARLILPG
jgi:hypothetical protein